MQQAIIYTNGGLVSWCIYMYVSLGLSELIWKIDLFTHIVSYFVVKVCMYVAQLA